MLQTKVSFEAREKINKLLGKSGVDYLQKVFALIQREAIEKGWPLREIVVRYQNDPEVKNWRYVVVTIMFDSSVEEAAGIMESLFPLIDSIRHIDLMKDRSFLEEIFYDFETI